MTSKPLIQHILVGVETKGLACDAAVQAVTLSRRFGARLDWIHAVEIPPPLWPGLKDKEIAAMHAEAIASERDAAVRQVKEALEHAGLEGVPVDDLHARPGHPAEVLLKEAEERGADLLVIGPHERRSLFDFGSTTRAVLGRTGIPIWMQAGAARPIRRVLVPVDLSEHSRLALGYATDLARALEASLTVLTCYEAPTFAYAPIAPGTPTPTYVVDKEREDLRAEQQRWVADLETKGVEARSVFVEGAPTERILEQSRAEDLVVLGTHGRTGLTRFLVGSVAYGVLRQSAKPVVAVPDPSRIWLIE